MRLSRSTRWTLDEAAQLADWRRRVAEIYARWRHESRSMTRRRRRTRCAPRATTCFAAIHSRQYRVDERARFGGLSYFDYDPAYRMTAVVEPAERRTDSAAGSAALARIAAAGERRRAVLVPPIGLVTPDRAAGGIVLPLFWMEGYAGGLFLPFRDATSGSETYGAGRYLLDTVKGADHGRRSAARASCCSTSTSPTTRRAPTTRSGTARWRRRRARLTVPVPVGERLRVERDSRLTSADGDHSRPSIRPRAAITDPIRSFLTRRRATRRSPRSTPTAAPPDRDLVPAARRRDRRQLAPRPALAGEPAPRAARHLAVYEGEDDVTRRRARSSERTRATARRPTSPRWPIATTRRRWPPSEIARYKHRRAHDIRPATTPRPHPRRSQLDGHSRRSATPRCSSSSIRPS